MTNNPTNMHTKHWRFGYFRSVGQYSNKTTYGCQASHIPYKDLYNDIHRLGYKITLLKQIKFTKQTHRQSNIVGEGYV